MPHNVHNVLRHVQVSSRKQEVEMEYVTRRQLLERYDEAEANAIIIRKRQLGQFSRELKADRVCCRLLRCVQVIPLAGARYKLIGAVW